ncbi:MAG: 30S ribosome-binding factor RbfA [Pseudomonadota bacterium]
MKLRPRRVADQIKRFLSQCLLTKCSDPRVSTVWITDVVLSADLKNAKIYYNLIDKDLDVGKAQLGLNSVTSFLRRGLSKDLKLKFTPTISWYYDESIDSSQRIDDLLDKLNN